MRQRRYLAASDAASPGVLFIDPQGRRRAYVVHIRPEIFDVWSHHETKIAQLELLTVYMGLAYNASSTRGMHGMWFVDNIAALMSLIRGRSNNEELDSMAGAIHGLLFALRSACYFLNGFSMSKCFGYVCALDGVLPQGECQMSDDTCDVGRFSNQSTQVQTVQT